MKTTYALALLLTAALSTSTSAGDAKVTLDSADGSSAFLVRDSASNELARVQSDGKVGLGIAAPAYTLDVLGDINLTGLFYTNGVAWNPLSSFTELDPLFGVSVAAGIVNADLVNWNTAFGWGNHATAGYLTAYTETDPVFAASVAAGITADSTNAWNAKLEGSGTEGYLPKFTASGTVGDSALFSDADGKVGIGTTTPAHKLDVNGDINMPEDSAVRAGGVWVLGATAGELAIGAATIDKDITFWAGSETPFAGFYDGKLGIGTSTPGYKLDVNGAINGSAITVGGVPVATSTDTYWSLVGTGPDIQYSGGNVGVGTATPAASAALEVTATDKGMLVPRLTQAQRNAIGAPATGLLIYQTDNNPGFYFFDGAQWSSISAGAGAVTAVSATAPLASSGGTTPTLSMPAAASSANGYLTSTDWSTFNNKVATTRTISTTAPLTGGGDLSANRTLSMPVATASANGYLSSANWTTFNAKESALTFSAPLSRSVNAISIPAATASVNGYLSSTDWTTFNNKVSAGANSTITSLTGLTTDLSVAQGGTGASDAAGARTSLGLGTAATLAAASANTASAVVQRDASGNFSAGTITATLSGTASTATKAANLVGGNNNTLYGAMPYQWGVDLTAWVAPNTTTTKKFLSMTGSGVNGATPVWDTAAAAGANSDITSLSGLTTDITVAQGGTGASTASAARTNLGLGTAATLAAASANTASAVVQRDASGNFSAGLITATLAGPAAQASNLIGGNSTTLYGAMPYQAGVNATSFVLPNTNSTKKFLSMTGSGFYGAIPVWDTAAAAGANSDITSLSGLTTDITVAQGGTGASTASAARTNLGLGTAATYPASANNVAGNVVVRDASGDVGVHTVFASGNVDVTGTLSVSGKTIVPTLDYGMAAKTAAQGSVATGTDVTWDTSYLRGAMTMNANRFLLKAGKTYELECSLRGNSSYCTQYKWVDSSNVAVGDVNVMATSLSANYNVGDQSQPIAKAVFTPAVDTYVKVRLIYADYSSSIQIGSYATVKQLQ